MKQKQIWSIEQRDPMSARAENGHTNFLPPQVNREGGKTSIFYIKIRFIIKYAFKIENLKVVILCFCNLSLFFLLKILHFLPRQNIHPWIQLKLTSSHPNRRGQGVTTIISLLCLRESPRVMRGSDNMNVTTLLYSTLNKNIRYLKMIQECACSIDERSPQFVTNYETNVASTLFTEM